MQSYKKVAISLAFLMMPLFAHAFSSGFIDGQVIEDGANVPLANVIVTVVWTGVAGSEKACLHSAVAFSDSNGRFRIAAWRHPVRVGRYTNITPVVMAYLPGYGQPTDTGPDRILLARDPSDKEQRLETLNRWRTEAACAVSPSSGRRIPSPLQSALLEEAKTLIDEESEPEALEPFLFDAEFQRFGESAAKQRQEARRNTTR